MMNLNFNAAGPTDRQVRYIRVLLDRFERLVDQGEASPMKQEELENQYAKVKTKTDASALIDELLRYVE